MAILLIAASLGQRNLVPASGAAFSLPQLAAQLVDGGDGQIVVHALRKLRDGVTEVVIAREADDGAPLPANHAASRLLATAGIADPVYGDAVHAIQVIARGAVRFLSLLLAGGSANPISGLEVVGLGL